VTLFEEMRQFVRDHAISRRGNCNSFQLKNRMP